MIRALGSILALMLAARSSAQTTQVSDFVSPCPNVFSYDPLATESDKWYGVVNLTTDIPLYSLRLNIVLENKANSLENWLGEVTTNDNIDFKIENTNISITPEQPLAVRFFIQYNANTTPPKLESIRFNGREICQVEPQVVESVVPIRAAVSYEEVRPGVTISTTAKPTVTTTSRNYNPEQTTLKAQHWYQTEKPETTVRTPGWSYVKADNHQQVTSTVKPINQTRSQTRTETKSSTTTENNSVSGQVQSLPYPQIKDRKRTANSQEQLQVQNNRKTTSENKYLIQNEIKQQITERAPVWPNVTVADNQNVSLTATRRSNFEIEVKQVGNTKYWSKLPENTTVVTVKKLSGTESTSYEWIEIEPRETPLPVSPGGDRQTISDRKYEPKNNVENRPQPYTGVGFENRKPARPVDSYQQTTEQRQQNTDEVRPPKIYEQSGAQRYGEGYQPLDEPARNRMVIQSGVEPSRYPTNDGRIKTLDGSNLSFNKYKINTAPPVPAPNKIEAYDYSKQEEFYEGGLPLFLIPNPEPPNTAEPACGKVLLNKQTAESLKSSSTLEGQWPWLIALYQQQVSIELHYKYICGGSLVSRRHIITAAHCVTRKSSASIVNRNTLAVLLGKHNLRTSVEGVEVKFVLKILIYPDYDQTNLRTDLAILELRNGVTFSNWIQPVCLWPEQETDLQNVVGKTGYTFGWGYDVANLPREELAQLQMEVVDQRTCLRSHPEFFSRFISDKTYCAGFSSTTTCNGRDSGGGMVFQKGDSWYLRGVVSLLVARQGPHNCDPNRYVIFTDVAKFLPWIQNNIEDKL